MPDIITEYPQFFTATNLNWQKLLKPNKYKDIIVESLRYLVERKRVILYGFVIMDNHLHLVWQMQANQKPSDVQRDFLKFTAQKIKTDLGKNHPDVLDRFKVNAKDRHYQFWERNPLSVEIWSEKVLIQKLKYIHENPIRAGLCKWATEYKYSSALLYQEGIDEWGFLTHYKD